jgi:2-phosphosulfolactate phosphatase
VAAGVTDEDALADRDAFRRQDGFRVRVSHGSEDLVLAGGGATAVAVVDVLRFTTCVSVAVSRGAVVLPYPWAGARAAAFASERHAELAGRREDPTVRWSLSPTDLLAVRAGTRLVLPSPNGAEVSITAAAQPGAEVYAACLRNAAVTAAALGPALARGPVVVAAAGEAGAWAVEDHLGAGAVVHHLVAAGVGEDEVSAEGRAALAAFRAAQHDLLAWLVASASGRQLVERGWDDDVRTAAELDADGVAARLGDDGFAAVAHP